MFGAPATTALPATPLSLAGDLLTAAALLVAIAVNAAVAAVVVRFFRLQLSTQWGAIIYAVLAIPVLYLLTTLVLFGALGAAAGVSLDRGSLFLFLWALPLALGISLEQFWMPPLDSLPAEPQEHQGR